MSLRFRLLALLGTVVLAMTCVAMILPGWTLVRAGNVAEQERLQFAEQGLQREWSAATTRLELAAGTLDRVRRAAGTEQAARLLEQAVRESGASRGSLLDAHGVERVVHGSSASLSGTASMAAILDQARRTGHGRGLVLGASRGAWVKAVGPAGPGDDAPVAVLELSLDSQLARRLAGSLGVELMLVGAVNGTPGSVDLGAAVAPDRHELFLAGARKASLEHLRDGAVPASSGFRPVRLDGSGGAELVGMMAAGRGAAADVLAEHRLILVLALIGIGGAGLLAVAVAAGSIRRGILAIDEAARTLIVGRGRYEPVVRAGKDELAQLSHTFNTMQESVQQREQRIRQAAYRDSVTRLPTRILFEERGAAMLAAVRSREGQASLLLVQVDHLREISDTLGWHAADAVLAELAGRFRGVLRGARRISRSHHASADAWLLARTGPQEFAVMLPDCEVATARNVGMRLIDIATRPFRRDDQVLSISARVGIAGYPDHGATVADLSQSADYALPGAARELGRVAIFDPALEVERERQLGIQADLGQALERRELHMVFQPKIGLRASAGLMAEALMRWNHPEQGAQDPVEFVEFAEKTGFISKLTAWAIDNALQHTATWRREGLPMTVSVNLSHRDLSNPEFPAQVIAALRRHELPGDALCFDVQDAILVGASAIMLRNMEVLSRAGASFAVDDFGSSFNSLEALAKLPLHSLKIDRRYISTMCEDKRSEIVVRAVIDLAHSMGLVSVAEGVESAEQLAVLRKMGCDQAQGYYVGRPLARNEFDAWVRHQASKYGVEGTNRRLRPRVADALSELDASPRARSRKEMQKPLRGSATG